MKHTLFTLLIIATLGFAQKQGLSIAEEQEIDLAEEQALGIFKEPEQGVAKEPELSSPKEQEFSVPKVPEQNIAKGPEPRKTVAIYVARGGMGYAEVLAANFNQVFTNSKSYAVAERQNSFLAMLQKEFDYQSAGNVDDSQLATIGKQSGAGYVIIIELMPIDDGHFMASRMINTESVAIVATSEASGKISGFESLKKMSETAAKGLIKSAEYTNSLNKSKKVAVFTVGGTPKENKLLGVKLVSAITSSKEYIAMERTGEFLSELKKEIEYQQSGNVNNSQLATLGQQFGVQFVCAAKISDIKFGNNSTKFLDVKLLDVNTAQVDKTTNVDFTYRDDIEQFMKIDNVTNSLLELNKKAATKWRTSTKVAIGLDILGLGLIAGGLWLNREVNTYIDTYNVTNSKESHDAATDAANKRNLAYGIGAVLLASGITVHFMF